MNAARNLLDSPLPRMNVKHDPGFCFRLMDDAGEEPYLKVIESREKTFELGFEIDLYQGQLSFSLMPIKPDFALASPEDVIGLADGCLYLQRWMDDCAGALIWAQGLFEKKEGKLSLNGCQEREKVELHVH